MHPNDSLLHEYIDHTLLETRSNQVHEHLVRCPACRERLEAMEARSLHIRASLDALSPTPREQTSLQSARARFTRFVPRKEPETTMFKKRPFWIALSILVVVVVAFSLTPVRAWASDFLSLFRVQRITVVQFDPAAAEANRQILEAKQGQIQEMMKGLTFDQGGDVTQVASLADAAAAAGFTPRLPQSLAAASLAVKPAAHGEYTIQREQLQGLFDAVGADIKIPAAADGQVVKVDVPAAFIASSGCPVQSKRDLAQANCTEFIQMPSPTINAPAGMDEKALGSAMLQFLGYSKVDANRLSEKIDWTSTLVLPVPQGEDIRYQDVQVDGVTGTYLEGVSSGGILIWVKDGVIYGLGAPGGLEKIQEIVGTLP
jgi:anti-sigma factor RsiW